MSYELNGRIVPGTLKFTPETGEFEDNFLPDDRVLAWKDAGYSVEFQVHNVDGDLIYALTGMNLELKENEEDIDAPIYDALFAKFADHRLAQQQMEVVEYLEDIPRGGFEVSDEFVDEFLNIAPQIMNSASRRVLSDFLGTLERQDRPEENSYVAGFLDAIDALRGLGEPVQLPEV